MEEQKGKKFNRGWFWLVGFIIFIIIVATIEAVSSPSKGNNSSDLQAKVLNDNTGIEITNQENADWTGCYVGVNGSTEWGFDNPPYRTHGPFWLGTTTIPAGKTITVNYSQLSKNDGTRFDFNSQAMNAILVDCFNNSRSWVGTR